MAVAIEPQRVGAVCALVDEDEDGAALRIFAEALAHSDGEAIEGARMSCGAVQTKMRPTTGSSTLTEHRDHRPKVARVEAAPTAASMGDRIELEVDGAVVRCWMRIIS